MKNSEAKASILFRHWIKANPRISGAYEMKDSRGKNYISFAEITDSQIAYGQAINSDKGVLVRVQGVNGEPDYIYLRNAPYYIVIKYPTCFVGIAVETFLLEKKKKSKSLSSTRAKEIATFSIE